MNSRQRNCLRFETDRDNEPRMALLARFRQRALPALSTPWTGASAELRARVCECETALLFNIAANERISLNWRGKEDSWHISLQIGAGGLLLDGRVRSAYSALLFRGSAKTNWSASIDQAPTSQNQGMIHVVLTDEARGALGLPDCLGRDEFVELPLDPHTAERFHHWALEQLTQPLESTENDKGRLHCWLTELFASSIYLSNSESAPNSNQSQLLSRACHLIESLPIGESPSSTTLAKRLAVSPRTLQRAFKNVYDFGVKQYIRNRNLAWARRQLLETDAPVSSVAHQAGFTHLSRFSQYYQEVFGLLPSETARSSSRPPGLPCVA